MNRAERRAYSRELAQQMSRGAVDLAAAAQQPEEPKVLFMGYVAGATVSTLWHESTLACAARSRQDGFVLRPRWVEADGSALDRARNMLVKLFLETDDEYLLLCDTDIAFGPQDIKLLLEADAPIAGALYFTAAAGMEPWPVALERREAEPAEGGTLDGSERPEPGLVPISLPEPPEDLPPEDMAAWMTAQLLPRRVDAVGAGLLLIRRDVVATLAEAYAGRPFAPDIEADLSGDAVFCLRADELGFHTVVVPGARVGNVRPVML